jgi:hypothetical protein
MLILERVCKFYAKMEATLKHRENVYLLKNNCSFIFHRCYVENSELLVERFEKPGKPYIS